jgi:uncharacterized membrane protein YdjX (TVP38/TMEM64 family)
MLNRIKDKIIEYKGYIILTIILVFFIISGYEYYYKYFYVLKDPENLKVYVMSYGKYSVFVFIAIQVIQVIAFFIPGEIVQIAGGYIFGTGIGSIISLAGITGGSILFISLQINLGSLLYKRLFQKINLILLRKY